MIPSHLVCMARTSFDLAPLILGRGGLAIATVAAEHRLSRSKRLAPHQALLYFLASITQTARGCFFVEQHLSADCMRRVALALITQPYRACMPSAHAQLLCNLLLIPNAAQAIVADNWESRLFSAGEVSGYPPVSAPDDDLWDCCQQSARPPTYRLDSNIGCKLQRLLHCCIWSPHFARGISTAGLAPLQRLQDILYELTQVKGLADTVTGQSTY